MQGFSEKPETAKTRKQTHRPGIKEVKMGSRKNNNRGIFTHCKENGVQVSVVEQWPGAKCDTSAPGMRRSRESLDCEECDGWYWK
jgi:hypothetical protein